MLVLKGPVRKQGEQLQSVPVALPNSGLSDSGADAIRNLALDSQGELLGAVTPEGHMSFFRYDRLREVSAAGVGCTGYAHPALLYCAIHHSRLVTDLPWTSSRGAASVLTSGSCRGRVGAQVQAELTLPTARQSVQALRWNPGDENWVATVSLHDCLVQLYDLQYCSVRAWVLLSAASLCLHDCLHAPRVDPSSIKQGQATRTLSSPSESVLGPRGVGFMDVTYIGAGPHLLAAAGRGGQVRHCTATTCPALSCECLMHCSLPYMQP